MLNLLPAVRFADIQRHHLMCTWTTEKDVVTTNAHVELQEGHAKIIGKPDVRVTVYFRK